MSALRKLAGNWLHLPGKEARRSFSNDTKPVLYSSYYSSCSWRVRIALGLKKIQYDIKPTSVTKPNATLYSNTNEYRELNPMQQVPTLQIDGHTLCDSVAIMHYLEETRPQHPLLPQDPSRRAKVRQIVQIICAGIQPLQNVSVLKQVGEEKSMEWAQHWISHGFCALEKVLSESSGKYCVGDEFSMADCCLVPQVFNARRYKVNLEPYPTILQLDRNLGANTIISGCHPYSQPDCPPKLANKQNIINN